MKLIIGGATGFVGKELLKQAIACPEITSIVTLGRRAVAVQDPKLTDIVVDDLSQYSDSVKEKIAGADACIWTIAIARTRSLTTPFEETKKVSLDYTLAGIRALVESKKGGQPLRFVYFSGAVVERVLKTDEEYPFGMPEYARLRATIEIDLVDYAAGSKGAVEVCCVRPGGIKGDRGEGYVEPQLPSGVPTIRLEECVAAALKQCVEGIEMDPIENADLVKIGREAEAKYITRK